MTEPVDPAEHGVQPQYPAPQNPAPQYPAPQNPASQYPSPQYPAPQHPTPQPGNLGYTPGSYPPYQGQQYADQPYQGQPYADQPYQGQPYAGQPYQGQPYAGQVYPGQPAEPSRKVSTKVIVAIVTIVVAAAVAVVAVVVSNSGSKSSGPKTPLTLPAKLGEYSRLTDATADRFRSQMQTVFGSGHGSGASEVGRLFATSALGVYAPPNALAQQRLILIAGRASDYPDLSPDQLSSSAFGSFGSAKSYPGGTHGGKVECVSTSLGSIDETECIWADKTSIGFTVSVDLSLDASTLAGLTNTARDTIDG